jgi:hypothetical protein
MWRARISIWAGLSAFALLPAVANAATYVNVRYGYVVSYPADLLVAEPEADAGDGRKFHARQGMAKMSVWAEWNLHDDGFDQSPTAVARRAASDCAGGRIGYRVVKPQLVALSCVTPKGRVIYQKTLVRRDVLTTVRFEYPDTERERWDRVVSRVAASLRQGKPAQ